MKTSFMKIMGVFLLIVAVIAAIWMVVGNNAIDAWKKSVVSSVRNSRGNYLGNDVDDIIRRQLDSGHVEWYVYSYDFPFLDACVSCSTILMDGSSRIFLFQWDCSWPAPVALTPTTASVFPALDPGVSLDPTGQSVLPRGKVGLNSYFSAGRETEEQTSEGHGNICR